MTTADTSPVKPACGYPWRPDASCGRPAGHLGFHGDEPAEFDRFDGPTVAPTTTAPATPATPEPLDLDAIEARANAATPGPWAVANDTRIVRGLQVTGRGSYTCIQSVAEVDDVDDRCDWGSDEAVEVEPEADAEFIAHARQDVPALVAEVRRLRGESAQLRDAMIGQHEAAGHALAVHAQGEDCSWCVRAADECDGAYACEDWKAWQAQYEAALCIPTASPATTDPAPATPPEHQPGARTYELPPEPPPEVTELWSSHGTHWQRHATKRGYWTTGRDTMSWHALLAASEWLSRTPPAGTVHL